MQARPALSDGDPVATVGDKTIGKTWFDWAVAQQKADEASQKGMDPAMADKFSQLAALVEGLNEIIVAQAVLDFKLEPAMAAAEKQFDSQFEDQKAEGDFLSSQHMTKDRLKGLWAGNAVAGKIAEMKGIDASNESQVKQAFADWINERLGQLNVVFTDTARETLFKGYLEQMRSNAAGQTSGTESEGMMMGHGDMPTSTGQ
jgi:hypothetical protein